MIKYYIWKNGDHADADGFFDFQDAFNYAMEIGADEIEETTWYSDEAYENGEPADKFKIVWRAERS